MSDSNDGVVAKPLLTSNEDTLRDIQSFSDALQALADAGIQVHSTEEFGDGFKVLQDKNRLVDVPFIILGFRFHDGENGEFAIAHVVTESNEKLILTDGGSGIRDQLKRYAGHGVESGLMVPRGLIRSDYKYDDPTTGEKRPGTTYYLS